MFCWIVATLSFVSHLNPRWPPNFRSEMPKIQDGHCVNYVLDGLAYNGAEYTVSGTFVVHQVLSVVKLTI